MAGRLTIDQITALLVDQMIHLTKVVPSWFGTDPCTELFTSDLRQFTAINTQLDMLLCTHPLTCWAIIDWHHNFLILLAQVLRQTHHCLAELTTILNNAPPEYSARFSTLWRELAPLLTFASSQLINEGSSKKMAQ